MPATPSPTVQENKLHMDTMHRHLAQDGEGALAKCLQPRNPGKSRWEFSLQD